MKDGHENGGVAEKFGLRTSRQAGDKRIVEVDLEKYASLLDAPEIGEADRTAMLEALWNILMVLADLGFRLESSQEACGQFEQAATERPKEGQNLLNSQDTERRNE